VNIICNELYYSVLNIIIRYLVNEWVFKTYFQIYNTYFYYTLMYNSEYTLLYNDILLLIFLCFSHFFLKIKYKKQSYWVKCCRPLKAFLTKLFFRRFTPGGVFIKNVIVLAFTSILHAIILEHVLSVFCFVLLFVLRLGLYYEAQAGLELVILL
jgi:hypothetical protein